MANEGPPEQGVLSEQPQAESLDDGTVFSLSKQLERERDERLQERFSWACLSVALIDLAVFPSMNTWAGPAGVIVIEIFGLIAFAKNCGVEAVQEAVVLARSVIASWRKD